MTDAHVRSAVWFIRGLAAAGVPVLVLGERRSAAGFRSRGVVMRSLGPGSSAEPSGFRAAVERLAGRGGGALVYPSREESIDALLGSPLDAAAALPYPDASAVDAVRHKPTMSAAAERAGLRPPRTLYAGVAAALDPWAITIPAVAKPMSKGTVLVAARVVEDRAALEAVLAPLPPDEPILVQEHVEGPLMGLSLVLDRAGEVAAQFQQVATRTWPADAGPSRYAVSVAPDPDVTARARELLAGLGFWGLAGLQFIASADGPRLIDVNPRTYGSISLALASGVNLPAVWHAVATGAAPSPPPAYRTGVTYRWLEAELYAGLRGDVRPLLRRAASPRVGAFWSAADPVPSALLAGQAATGWVGRQLRRSIGAGRW